ncbi:MAG: caspase family protein [Prevotella sp.]|nr:caspase family protein [Prevotella sp.]
MRKTAFIILWCVIGVMPLMGQTIDQEVVDGCEFLRMGRFDKAYASFSKGARFGSVVAQYYLAYCQAEGYGVAKDDNKAFFLYRRVAERGLPVAQARLAYLLYKGIGTNKDVAKARYWIDKATNYSNVDSYTTYVLGLCYEEGLGREKDMEKAMECFQKSCKKNVDEALIHTAMLFAEGRQLKQDFPQALGIINNAIENVGSGFDYACKGRILTLMGNKKEAGSVWRSMISNYPYYAVQSSDDFSMYMRGTSPIPNDVITGLYAKADVASKSSKYSYNSLEEDDNHANNSINITYTMAPSIQHQETATVPSIAPTPKAVTPVAPTPKEEEVMVDVDVNLPTTNVSNDNTFAVIIANEHYQDVAAVPYANNDGTIFAEYCRKSLGLPATNVHLVKDATLNNMKREINWLKQVSHAYKGSAKIIVYFAGHGIPDEATRNAYLLPVDGFATDITTGYSLQALYATLGDLQAKSITVLLDACFSGSMRDGGMMASARGVAIKAKNSAPKGNMVVFSAASGEETAYPYKEKHHGLFTYYLLKKLQMSKGNISLGDLQSYVTEEVAKKSIVVNGKSQTPTISFSATVGEDWKKWNFK